MYFWSTLICNAIIHIAWNIRETGDIYLVVPNRFVQSESKLAHHYSLEYSKQINKILKLSAWTREIWRNIVSNHILWLIIPLINLWFHLILLNYSINSECIRLVSFRLVLCHLFSGSKMVFFTCDSCGASLKKNQVEKHYLHQCRSCSVLTCIDCQRDFPGDTYKEHIKCISEEEKYSAKGWQPKASANKVTVIIVRAVIVR